MQENSSQDDFFDERIDNNRKSVKHKRTKKTKLQQPSIQLNLANIIPKTDNQNKVFESYLKDKSILLNGIAGCGKSFLSLYLSLEEILANSDKYKKLFIIRSVVSSRDMGFLPGSVSEKAKVFEAPYYSICSELFGRGDAYDILKKKDIVEFVTSSFLRGTTFRDCILVVDEFQNMTFEEINTVLTRVGDNCKLLICGDTEQKDLKKEDSCYNKITKILGNMNDIDTINFDVNDIVRSGFVKNYLIEKNKLGY